MPQERHNPYPRPSVNEIHGAPGERAEKAARFIATREFHGIPQRAFILGDNDHSPVMRSLRTFTPEVYRLLELVEGLSLPPDEECMRQVHVVRDMLDNPVILEMEAQDVEEGEDDAS